MDKYIKTMQNCKLFEGLSVAEIKKALDILQPRVNKYKKNDFIISAGESINDIAIVLLGSVKIVKEDIRGTRSIIAECGCGDLFAEALACAHVKFSPVSVIADSVSEIMFINFDSIINSKLIGQKALSQIVQNMITILAGKNVFLNNKLEHISKRTLRGKLLSFFTEMYNVTGKKELELPFSKTDLADFLFIDRSAMSRELSNMEKEKIILVKGKNIILNTKK